jgi:hypothetical protein
MVQNVSKTIIEHCLEIGDYIFCNIMDLEKIFLLSIEQSLLGLESA